MIISVVRILHVVEGSDFTVFRSFVTDIECSRGFSGENGPDIVLFLLSHSFTLKTHVTHEETTTTASKRG